MTDKNRLFVSLARRLSPSLVFPLLFLVKATVADEVSLMDGSFLVGSIRQLHGDVLVMDTAFAKDLNIRRDTIVGITTDAKVMVQLSSGDRVHGKLKFADDGSQALEQTTFGDIILKDGLSVTAIGEPTPGEGETRTGESMEEAIVKVKEGYEDKIQVLSKENSRLKDPWSGRISLGASGKQGNTDSFNLSGRGEATRDTGFDRLNLYVEGNLEEQNGLTSTNEVIAGASLEHDLSDRWFIFGSTDFEKDEFENLDLRGVAKAGAGYFFIRRPHMFFKGLAGVGYQHESFSDGTTLETGIISIGYDFEYNYDEFWKFGHKLTYFPSVDSPVSDYRLSSVFFTELPLKSEGWPWKLRLSIRNDFDNLPRPAIKKLDTSYLFNIVYEFE